MTFCDCHTPNVKAEVFGAMRESEATAGATARLRGSHRAPNRWTEGLTDSWDRWTKLHI